CPPPDFGCHAHQRQPGPLLACRRHLRRLRPRNGHQPDLTPLGASDPGAGDERHHRHRHAARIHRRTTGLLSPIPSVSEFNHGDFKTVEKAMSAIRALESEFSDGNGLAGYLLSIVYSEGNTFETDEVRKAIGTSDLKALDYMTRSFPLLKKSAEAGDAESMHM